jgi:hypothetical protein
MFELHKIHLGPAVRVAAIMGLVIGLVFFVLSFGYLLLQNAFSYSRYSYSYGDPYGYNSLYREWSQLSAMFGVVLLMSVISSVVLALITVPLYNLLAEHVGGFAIDLERVKDESAGAVAETGQ